MSSPRKIFCLAAAVVAWCSMPLHQASAQQRDCNCSITSHAGACPDTGGPVVTAVCVGQQIHLVVTTGGMTASSYSWSVVTGGSCGGPEGTISFVGSTTASCVTVQGATGGIVTLTCEVHGSGGGCTRCDPEYCIRVNPNPAATASSNSPICQGQTLLLTSGPNLMTSYSWTGPNSFSSPAQNPTIPNAQPAATGTYTVTVTDSNGCTAQATTDVTVNANPLNPHPQASPDTICFGQCSDLTVSDPRSPPEVVEWFSDSNCSTSLPSTHVCPPVGINTYYARVRNTATGCVSACVPVTVTVNPNPTDPHPVASPSTICFGQCSDLSVTDPRSPPEVVEWFSDSNCSISLPSTHVCPPVGINTYYVRVRNIATGCVSACVPVTVTVNPNPTDPHPVATPPEICFGHCSDLSVSDPRSPPEVVEWFSDSNCSSSLPSTHVCPPVGINTYYVRVRNTETGCFSACVPVTVTVNSNAADPVPQVDYAKLCDGGCAMITVATPSGPYVVEWFDDANCTGPVVATGSPRTVCPTVDTTYYVRIRNTSTNCVSNCVAVPISVNPRPVCGPIITNAHGDICPNWAGYYATINPTPLCTEDDCPCPYTFHWTITGGSIVAVPGPDVQTIIFQGTGGAGTLTVTATDCKGCTCQATFGFTTCPNACQTGTLELIGPSGCKKKCDTVEVALWMKNVNCPVAGYQAFLQYDSSKLHYLGCVNNPFYPWAPDGPYTPCDDQTPGCAPLTDSAPGSTDAGIDSEYDPASPFPTIAVPINSTVGSSNHPVLGQLVLAAGINIFAGQLPVNNPPDYRLAILRFRVSDDTDTDCEGLITPHVAFRTNNPPTSFTDLAAPAHRFGVAQGLVLIDPAPFKIDGVAPIINNCHADDALLDEHCEGTVSFTATITENCCLCPPAQPIVCQGQQCGTFTPCAPPDCFCWTTPNGGVCGHNFPCNAYANCTGDQCPPGFFCAQLTCCGASKCVPDSNRCSAGGPGPIIIPRPGEPNAAGRTFEEIQAALATPTEAGSESAHVAPASDGGVERSPSNPCGVTVTADSADPITVGTPTYTVVPDPGNPGHYLVSGTVPVSGMHDICPASVNIHVQASDCCGNTSLVCPATAHVSEKIPPVITHCPGNATIQCDESIDPSNPNLGSATATDNCDDHPEITYTDSPSVLVTPSIPNGWTLVATESYSNTAGGDGVAELVNGPPIPPLGTGSAHLFTGTDGTQSAQLRNAAWAGTRIDALTVLKYSTYATSWNGQQLPYLTINLDTDGDSVLDDRLHFEPAYSGAAFGRPQPDPALNTWQTWDCLAGYWYSDSGIGGSGGSDAVPLATYLASYPNATIVNDAYLGGNSIRVASGFASDTDVFDANVDAFIIGTASLTKVYNFELGGCANYEITRTWKATDNCGNTATCVQTIDVVDTTPPSITCPTSPIAVSCETGSTDPSNTGNPTVHDNCDPHPQVGYEDQVTQCGVELLFDGFGGEAEVTAGVLHLRSGFDGASDYGYGVAIWRPSSPITFSQLTNLGVTYESKQGCMGGGSPRFSIRIDRDGDGVDSAGDCSVWVYLEDLIPPIDQNCLSGPQNTGNLIGAGPGAACRYDGSCVHYCTTYADVLTAVGGKGVLRISLVVDAGWSQPPDYVQDFNFDDWVIGVDGSDTTLDFNCPDGCSDRDIIRTWTATDACGNSNSCTQQISVRDTTPPVITSCSALGGSVDENCMKLVTFQARVCDNCCIDVSGIVASASLPVLDSAVLGDISPLTVVPCSPADAHCICIEGSMLVSGITGTQCPVTVNISIDANDCCGNHAQACNTQAFVSDDTPPAIHCPPDITVECGVEPVTGACCFRVNNENRCVEVSQDTCTALAGSFHASTPCSSVDCDGPNPECSAANCNTFVPCNNNGACVCVQVSGGGGLCVIGATGCGSLAPCVNGTCPPGSFCAVNTCCGTPVCVPPSAFCPSEIQRSETLPPPGTLTIRGVQPELTEIADGAETSATTHPRGVTRGFDPTDPFFTGYALAKDNCDPDVFVDYTDAVADFDCTQPGHVILTVHRTWTATDECHNVSTCTQVITLVDTTPPHITCPGDATIECDESIDPSNPHLGSATAHDDCDPNPHVTYSDSVTGQGCDSTRVIHRTWKATDECGNSSTCVQTITIVDTTAPVITSCNALGGNVDGNCQATVHFRVKVCDNCCINFNDIHVTAALAAANATLVPGSLTWAQLACNPADPHCICIQGSVVVENLLSCPATVNITVNADDCCGNHAQACHTSADVNDITPPAIHCPTDRTVQCPGSTEPGNTGTATATDNCDPTGATVIIGHTDSPVDSDCTVGPAHIKKTITRTWTATDACHNTSTCTQIITYVDTIPPTFDTCPLPPVTATLNSGNCTGTATLTTPTAHDTCDPSPVVSGPVPAGPYPPGNTTVTWTARDACGNTSTCTQVVTVDAALVTVGVELSPTMTAPMFTAGPPGLKRCVEFKFWSCPGGAPVATISANVEFFNYPQASNGCTPTPHAWIQTLGTATLCVPGGFGNNLTCATAQDVFHTLRSTITTAPLDGLVMNSPTSYTANWTGKRSGEPFGASPCGVGTGHRLVGGNVNNDNFIDILDFGTWAALYNTNYGTGDTLCGPPAPPASLNADINGDGTVSGIVDFSFIAINFLMIHEPNCCGQPLLAERNPLGGNGPLISVSVRELRQHGLGHLAAGDVNGDGTLDMFDMAEVLLGNMPKNERHDVVPTEVTVPPVEANPLPVQAPVNPATGNMQEPTAVPAGVDTGNGRSKNR